MKLLWGLASVALAGADGAVVFLLPLEKTNIDWMFGLVAGPCISVVALGWLLGLQRFDTIDWSRRYSWSTPFIPMNKYPFQFWWVVTGCLVIGCGLATVIAWFVSTARFRLSLALLLMGLFPLTTVYIWSRLSFRSRRNSN
jgi:hypothetical protein